MRKVSISLLQSVNNLPFLSKKEKVREVFGPDFKEPENHLHDPGVKEFMQWVNQEFSRISGQPIEDFEKYDEEDDDDENCDYYEDFRIDYNKDNQYEAIEIYADKKVELTVEGKSFSEFKIKDLLTLAEDFVWEKDDTAWVSYSRQIGIWCPKNKNTVESILFGCPGYYTREEN